MFCIVCVLEDIVFVGYDDIDFVIVIVVLLIFVW